jgi:hypothetical protein
MQSIQMTTQKILTIQKKLNGSFNFLTLHQNQ